MIRCEVSTCEEDSSSCQTFEEAAGLRNVAFSGLRPWDKTCNRSLQRLNTTSMRKETNKQEAEIQKEMQHINRQYKKKKANRKQSKNRKHKPLPHTYEQSSVVFLLSSSHVDGFSRAPQTCKRVLCLWRQLGNVRCDVRHTWGSWNKRMDIKKKRLR